MKRKLIILLVIASMIFVAACGGSGSKEDASGNEDTAEIVPEEGEAEANTDAEGDADSQEGEAGEDSDDIGDAESQDPMDLPDEEEALPPSGDYPDYPTEGRKVTPEGDPHPDNPIWFSEGAGIAIEAPKSYLDNNDKLYVYHSGDKAENGLYEIYAYVYPANHDDLMAMNDDDFLAAEELSFNLMTIYRAAPKWTLDDLKNFMSWVDGVEDATVEEIGKDGDYTLYGYIAESYPDGLPDEVKTICDSITAELKDSIKNVSLYQPASYESMNEGSSLSASAKTVNGEDVNTGEIFAGNKFTMVNCWASWCGPCIQEMPELEEISKELEEKGCGLIGVLMDGNDAQGLSDGLDVIKDTGVTYDNVIVWEGFNDAITLMGYPTTFFVDQNGVIIGDAIIGADIDSYRERIKELLGE